MNVSRSIPSDALGIQSSLHDRALEGGTQVASAEGTCCDLTIAHILSIASAAVQIIQVRKRVRTDVIHEAFIEQV
jgi:hypothetical protein